jgi:hypothetical protein
MFGEKFEELAQVADAQPFDKIDMLLDGRFGFIPERRRDNSLHAGFARGIGE